MVLRENFIWYSYAKDGHRCHEICRECEEKIKLADEWRDGLLKCRICGEYYPEEDFGIKTTGKLRHYRDARCRKCRTKQAKEYFSKCDNNEKLRKMLQSRVLGARGRAKKANLEYNLTESWIKQKWDEQNGLCAISKIPMTYNRNNGRTFTNVSIDRINPNKGYTKDNVHLVCMGVNLMKSDMSIEELYMFCEAVLKNKK